MASNQPTTGREVLPAGLDVRKIRKPINEAFASVPIEFIGEGAATSRDGRRLSFSVVGEDSFYIRVTDRQLINGVHRYSWDAMVQDRENGTWANSPRSGNATTDDWAVELNDRSVSVAVQHQTRRYPARVNPQTGRVTFFDIHGGTNGGNVTANSTETVLMILGDYETYKDCPNVPAKPPTTYGANFPCDENRTDTLCVPAFAYAVYQRCGYVWNKVGDTRDYQVWANEMNGQSFSAWRRFVIPRWGGVANTTTGLPDPDDECIGVAFLGTGTGSALTCPCPSCINNACFRVSFRTPVRPAITGGCGSSVTDFDKASAWDKQYDIDVTLIACTGSAFSADGLFEVEITYIDGTDLECDWGPDTFDPCDPCVHWGRLEVVIYLANGGNNENCGGGAGHWRGEFSARAACEMLCTCTTPITPLVGKICEGCTDANGTIYFVDEATIELDCCPEGGGGGGGEGGGGGAQP